MGKPEKRPEWRILSAMASMPYGDFRRSHPTAKGVDLDYVAGYLEQLRDVLREVARRETELAAERREVEAAGRFLQRLLDVPRADGIEVRRDR